MRPFSTALLTAALFLPAIAALNASAPAAPETLLVWDNPKEDGVANYRIPQIIVTRTGLVIALAEARYKPGDGSQADIVIRRSRDGGKTWSKSQFIERGGPTDNHVLPGLLQDSITGRIFFFCALRGDGGIRANSTQSYYRSSDDEGVTWSEPVEVGSLLAAADLRIQAEIAAGTAPPAYAGDVGTRFNRQHFYFGPGRAIQLSAHHPRFPGRLVVPIFLIGNQMLRLRSERAYGDGVLLSDDQGKTWHAGNPVPLGSLGSSEVSVVELDDGRLLLNSRGALDQLEKGLAKSAPRTLSWSSDGGETWTRPIEDNSGLPHYTETHSGLLRVPASDAAQPSRFLFSFPIGPGRTHGMVYLSTDDHRSWIAKKLIVPGTFGYSNLDHLPDGTLLLLYEEASGARVHLVRFSFDWLTGTDAASP